MAVIKTTHSPTGSVRDGQRLATHLTVEVGDGALSEFVAIDAPAAPKVIVVDGVVFTGNTVGTTVNILDAAKKVANIVLPVQEGPLGYKDFPYVCTAGGPLWITTQTASQWQCTIIYYIATP